jgi:phospholipid-binding lipoprotein MlaA
VALRPPDIQTKRRERTEMGTRKVYGWLVILSLLLMPFLAYAEDPPSTGQTGEAVSAESVDTAKAGQEEFPEIRPIADPLEPWNRLIFFLNDRLYFALVKPVAQVYGLIVPEWGRVRVRNVFDNLKMPVRFVSSLLQLKIRAAGVELARFAMNSTIGFGGMFDLASQNPDLKGSDEDLGLTLGHYGIGEGFFIVWPFLGPSSARDSVGLTGDLFLNPVSYITPFKDWLAVRSYQFENDVSLRIGEYEDLTESSLDPYVAMKDAYSEYRRNKVKEGAGEEGGAGPSRDSGWPGR